MKEQDLTVHEWGVFTVFNDRKYANLNRKAEWGDLPDFFYRQFPKQRLRWAPSPWDKMKRSNPWETDQLECGRFIFYDGLVPSPDYLHCLASDARSATVKNTAGFPIGRLYLIDRREPENPQAVRTTLGIAEERKIEFAPAGGLTKFIGKIRADLIEAGLFEAEADSLLKIWHKGFFEHPGVVAFYLLPRSEYDAMLILGVSPKPAITPTRVGIAFHLNFDAEPAITARVEEWIAQLDSDDFKTRKEAIRQLTSAGPFARRLLEQAAKNGSVEMKISARMILETDDASVWLK